MTDRLREILLDNGLIAVNEVTSVAYFDAIRADDALHQAIYDDLVKLRQMAKAVGVADELFVTNGPIPFVLFRLATLQLEVIEDYQGDDSQSQRKLLSWQQQRTCNNCSEIAVAQAPHQYKLLVLACILQFRGDLAPATTRDILRRAWTNLDPNFASLDFERLFSETAVTATDLLALAENTQYAEELVVYQNRKQENGRATQDLSWLLEQKWAQQVRRNERPQMRLYRAIVKRKAVIAYFPERREVLIPATQLRQITKLTESEPQP